jgi:hypothetical protein
MLSLETIDLSSEYILLELLEFCAMAIIENADANKSMQIII